MRRSIIERIRQVSRYIPIYIPSITLQQIYVVRTRVEEYTAVGDDCRGLPKHMLATSWVTAESERLEREQEEYRGTRRRERVSYGIWHGISPTLRSKRTKSKMGWCRKMKSKAAGLTGPKGAISKIRNEFMEPHGTGQGIEFRPIRSWYTTVGMIRPYRIDDSSITSEV